GAGDAYYVARSLESDFLSFLGTSRSAMAIVGRSGFGKTTLVAQLLRRCADAGHLAAMFESVQLPPNLDAVEPYIIRALAGEDRSPLEFWSALSKECARRNKTVVLFVDA